MEAIIYQPNLCHRRNIWVQMGNTVLLFLANHDVRDNFFTWYSLIGWDNKTMLYPFYISFYATRRLCLVVHLKTSELLEKWSKLSCQISKELVLYIFIHLLNHHKYCRLCLIKGHNGFAIANIHRRTISLFILWYFSFLFILKHWLCIKQKQWMSCLFILKLD